MDNDNYGLKDELRNLKEDLLKMKEIALSQKVKWAISTKIYFLKNKIIKKYYFLIYNYNSWN